MIVYAQFIFTALQRQGHRYLFTRCDTVNVNNAVLKQHVAVKYMRYHCTHPEGRRARGRHLNYRRVFRGRVSTQSGSWGPIGGQPARINRRPSLPSHGNGVLIQPQSGIDLPIWY